jgi:anti-sigma factor RsiW
MTCQEARDLMVECLTGSTAPDTRRGLQAHLQECEVCAAEAHGFEEMVALLRAVPEPRVSETQWQEFSSALQLRLDREAQAPWNRVKGWLRKPRVAWGTAVATAAFVVALAGTLLFRTTLPPTASKPLPPTYRGLVTESMARMTSSMATTLSIWDAQLAEAPPSPGIPGE